MSRNHFLVNAILWASAILASAILHAPAFLTLVLLPLLAMTGMIATRPPCRKSADRALRELVAASRSA